MAPEAERQDTPEIWWRRRLAGLEPSLDLPAERPWGELAAPRRPSRLELAAGGSSGCLAALELVAARPSREVDTAVLLAGVAALCSRLSGSDDLALGTAVAGTDGGAGLAVLRFRFAPYTPFGELFTQARGLMREAADRGPVPPALAAATNPPRHPFTQVMVAVRWPGEAEPNASAMRLTEDAPLFDLAWTLDRAVAPARLVLELDGARFGAAGRFFLRSVRSLLIRGLGDPAVPIDRLAASPVPVS